jgi:hypothetical protein
MIPESIASLNLFDWRLSADWLRSVVQTAMTKGPVFGA